MTQDLSQELAASPLSTMEQLLIYIQQTAIDSENTPIAPDEVAIVANLIIQRLILQSPCLDQTVQEILDDLRFSSSAGSPALYLYSGERRDESQGGDELTP